LASILVALIDIRGLKVRPGIHTACHLQMIYIGYATTCGSSDACDRQPATCVKAFSAVPALPSSHRKQRLDHRYVCQTVNYRALATPVCASMNTIISNVPNLTAGTTA